MFIKSPAKINLYLHITGKQLNGYHEIDSIFVKINFYDKLRIKNTTTDEVSRNGDLSGLGHSDLCFRAAMQLKKETGYKGGCNIHLTKKIPIGAGLGGGSSNAASVLTGLNQMWKLGLSNQDLREIGRFLGADIPFFIKGENCLVEGIGEKLKSLKNLNILPSHVVTLTPKIQVSTKLIFQNLIISKSAMEKNRNSQETKRFPSTTGTKPSWTFGTNDLQETVFKLFPKLEGYMEAMKHTADKLSIPRQSCRITGTGSTIFCAISSENLAMQFVDELKIFLNSTNLNSEGLINISEIIRS
jgi:4-diphosphocytidyl-2-C-methyl-D-erythritol kinase